jgi:hypothetical protein
MASLDNSCAVGSRNGRRLIGCGNVGCVVGAEALTESTGVWVKTRLYRKGPFLCATIYSVAAGEPKVVELKVDLRPIEQAVRKAHAQLHARDGSGNGGGAGPSVSGHRVGWGLGSLWKGAKKAAQKIGRNKLLRGVVKVTRAVGKVAKTVVRSKAFGIVLAAAAVFPLTAPFAAPALGAYAACNAALSSAEVGAKVLHTAKSAIGLIHQGKQAASAVASATSSAKAAVASATAGLSPSARASLGARAKAAGQLSLSPQGKVAIQTALSRAPAGAARTAVATKLSGQFKQLSALRSRAVLAQSLPPSAGAAVATAAKVQANAAPLVARAAQVQKAFSNPATQAKLTALRARGQKATELLTGIHASAQSGTLDGVKSAAIVNLVARNRARIQAMSQAHAGGLPGLLITPQGKLVKGRFRVQAKAGGQGLLYLGKGTPTQKGSFATVAGELGDAAGELADTVVGACSGCVGAVVVPLVGAFASLIGLDPTGCYQVSVGADLIAGDVPLDGVRLSGKGPAAGELGPYEVGACGTDCDCGPCRQSA